MSRCRMVYAIGGESLNDIKKSDRYDAPPLQLWDDEGELSPDEPFFPPAPGPTPERPQKPRYLQRKGKRRRLNPPEDADPNDQPGPSGLNNPDPPTVVNNPNPPTVVNNPDPPTRSSGRVRKRPTRLVEE